MRSPRSNRSKRSISELSNAHYHRGASATKLKAPEAKPVVVNPKLAMKGAKWAGLGVARAGSARGSNASLNVSQNQQNRAGSARSNRSN